MKNVNFVILTDRSEGSQRKKGKEQKDKFGIIVFLMNNVNYHFNRKINLNR